MGSTFSGSTFILRWQSYNNCKDPHIILLSTKNKNTHVNTVLVLPKRYTGFEIAK